MRITVNIALSCGLLRGGVQTIHGGAVYFLNAFLLCLSWSCYCGVGFSRGRQFTIGLTTRERCRPRVDFCSSFRTARLTKHRMPMDSVKRGGDRRPPHNPEKARKGPALARMAFGFRYSQKSPTTPGHARMAKKDLGPSYNLGRLQTQQEPPSKRAVDTRRPRIGRGSFVSVLLSR